MLLGASGPGQPLQFPLQAQGRAQLSRPRHGWFGSELSGAAAEWLSAGFELTLHRHPDPTALGASRAVMGVSRSLAWRWLSTSERECEDWLEMYS